MNLLEGPNLQAAEQVFLLAAVLAILLFVGSIRLIIHLRPRSRDETTLWMMWVSVMAVVFLAVVTLAGSAISIWRNFDTALLLLQAFFTISTSACALFGLLLLSNTFSSLRSELSRRKELEAINAEHQTGMEKMILERTANLRQEILERQKLTRVLMNNSNTMESDLRLAGTLQRALMPEHIAFAHVTGAIQYHPVGHVSGDFYDRMSNEQGDVFIFCGDAMGHGTPAALFTFMLSAALRSSDRYSTPAQILYRINQMLMTRNLELYATGVLACISKDGLLTIAHAGHESALLQRSDGEFHSTFEKSGFALGMFGDQKLTYQNETLQLEKGDRLIMFTDGITESANRNGQRFGLEQLKSIIRDNRQSTLEQTSATVIEELYDHMDEQPMRDDLTLLVTEYGEFDV